MASGRITLSYTTTSNGATSATVRVTMTYYGNGETWNSSPSSNNCYITLNGTTKYFTHAYTTSTSAQSMGYADFTITKTHSTQSLTATGGITNYSTYYSNPTGSCTVSVSAKTSYTITYNANGGSGAPSNQTKWYGETLILSTSQPTRTGYVFAGWWTATSGGTQYGTTYTTNAAATLYAHWTAHTRTFKFNGNGNTGGSMSDQSISYASSGTTNLNTNTFTKTNNEFVKWNTNSAGTGTDYSNEASIARNTITSTSTINLYAQWKVSYIASNISNINAYRCDINGQRADEGRYGYLTFQVSKYTNGSTSSFPSVNAVYNSSSTITLSSSTSGDVQTYTAKFGDGGLALETQYPITITVTDGSYGSYTTSTFISAAFFTIDITANGKGIGLLTSAPTVGINVSTAIKNLGASGLSATGTGGIAIGARSSTNTISSAGSGSIASGYAQGGSIEATTKGAFAGGLADGNNITASGVGSFAFGQSSNTAALTASGNGSIAMGLGCTSSGPFSLTHNMYTTASGRAQTVLGTWNIIDDATTSTHPTGISNLAQFKKYAFIIGNGTSDSARSNAFAVTWDGKVELNSESLFKWTQIGSGSNTTSKITFSSTTGNYSEIMVVASTKRNTGYHLFSGILPATIIDDTDREFKLSGGVGSVASTTCGAWGKIVTTGFTPVGVWINSTAWTDSTDWYIYGR